MRKQLLTSAFVYFLLPVCTAQPVQEKLNQWAIKNPIEKIYLHLDRDQYVPGETIWLKAYLSSDFLPADKSTVLFVDLLNSSSAVLSRLTLPVIRAVSQGQFDLPDTLITGQYIIRAYTATMLNNDPDFVYKRRISISGKENRTTPPLSTKNVRLEFFPEGGNFIAGQPNTIAFKSTNESGWPADVKAVVKNSKHQIVAEFSSLHDGMGMFDLEAELNESYYAELQDDPAGQKYFLPIPTEKGIVFRLLQATDGIRFEIFQKKNDPVFEAAYMVGQMQHHAVFQQSLQRGSATFSGIINIASLSSGILHITVFNKDGLPLAERLSFINNKEYIKDAQLLTETLDLSPKAKNHFTLAFKDSVAGSFSVSITDPMYSDLPIREENILSGFLLTSDLKGYIHNPAYYFSSDSDSVKYALDLVMMTNGWRRFKWEKLLKDQLQRDAYKDPAFASLSGRVTLQGTDKPFAEKDLLIYILSADSSKTMQLVRTDKNGNYKLDSLLFFGKSDILISDINGKRSKFIDISSAANSLNQPYALPTLTNENQPLLHSNRFTNEATKRKLIEQHEAQIKRGGNVLSEVVVKSKVKTPIEELEDKYASGLFSGDSRQTIDLLNSDEAINYENIFDYLQFRVPGLKITLPNYETTTPDDPLNMAESGARYEVFYRQNPSVSSLGPIPMTIFLNEVITSTNVIASIPASRIVMIKVFSNFMGAWGGGAGGALAIYTRKGDELSPSISSGARIVSNGFSIIREFYSPDYAVPQKNIPGPDHRITLYWKPDIFVTGKEIRIPINFYNNDRSRSFKIVVEGMTTDGKMLLIEKNIVPKSL